MMKRIVDKYLKQIGMALVLAGAILLIVAGLADWTGANWMLLIPLIIIVIGVACHVYAIKKKEKY